MIDLPSQKILLNNLKKPKAIIFDWDNTLVDTWPLIKTAINNTMSKMGRDHWSLEKVKNTVHKSMRDSFQKYLVIIGNKLEKFIETLIMP